jgi:hypothetical protein
MIEFENGIKYLLNRIYLEFTDGIHNYVLPPPKYTNLSTITWMIDELIKNEIIVNKIHPFYIKENFLKGTDKVNTQSILNQFLKNLDFPKLVNTIVLRESLSKGVQDDIFKLEIISRTEFDSKSSQGNSTDYNISFKGEEMIGLPDQSLQSTVETGIKDNEGELQKNKKILTLSFPSLISSEIHQIKKGIVEPLEAAEGDFEVEISVRITNPEKMKNKMTLPLIKETTYQLKGILTEEE